MTAGIPRAGRFSGAHLARGGKQQQAYGKQYFRHPLKLIFLHLLDAGLCNTDPGIASRQPKLEGRAVSRPTADGHDGAWPSIFGR